MVDRKTTDFEDSNFKVFLLIAIHSNLFLLLVLQLGIINKLNPKKIQANPQFKRARQNIKNCNYKKLELFIQFLLCKLT